MVFQRTFALIGLSLTLVSCQINGPADEVRLQSDSKPQQLMVQIARNAQKCWFKSGNNASFSKYRLANEVNSYAGKPRILLVPKTNPGGLPALVVQAERQNNKTKLHAYGPFLSTSSGKRVSNNLETWTNGSKSC